MLSSADSINVGGQRLLQYGLEDTYGNRLKDSTVTYTRIEGNGLFSNGLAAISPLTNTGGVAEALYTASDNLSFVTDRIVIAYGTIPIRYARSAPAFEPGQLLYGESVRSACTNGGRQFILCGDGA